MNRIGIDPEGRFSIGGENFLITVPVKERRLSNSEAFTIAKNEPYLRVYEDLASAFSPRSILELGIFEGGSYVLLDKLFKPRRMSAVDKSRDAVKALCKYVTGREGRFVHFSTSQSDRKFWKISSGMNLRTSSISWLTMRPILTNRRRCPLKFSSRCSSPAASI